LRMEDDDHKMTVVSDQRDEHGPGMIVWSVGGDEMACQMMVLFCGCVATAQKLCCRRNFLLSFATPRIIERTVVGARSSAKLRGSYHCRTNLRIDENDWRTD